MPILCYTPTTDGQPTRAALEALTRAREVAAEHGTPLEGVVLDPDAPRAAEVLARHGAARVHAVSHGIFGQHQNAPVLAALGQVIAEVQPELVVCPSTEGVKDVLGALATRLDAPAVPDVAEFSFDGTAVEALRPVMAAKFMARVRAEGRPVLVSVRSGSYEASESPVEAELIAVPFQFDQGELRQALREVVSAAAGAVDLSEARVVVAAGRGVRDERARQLVEELAEVTGAAVGATRAVVESGMYPATAQIGQTGKVVSPELYFAVGLSGAIQHTAGMSNSRVIVAINKDPDAPIFQIATYGLVGDLYEVLPALIGEIRKVNSLLKNSVPAPDAK